eukprot:TRINITY_DN4326_c0_g2_i1.p1 TRINITY_DN4326_c0_g2~~TRINITY_DN4326_c0_g2_i1.p1  ORF type:complete len:432 (+),score=31.95 TRINITY_DN4326_c0_g2_i1:250-1545(+)
MPNNNWGTITPKLANAILTILGIFALFLLFHSHDEFIYPNWKNIVVIYRGMWLPILYLYLFTLNVYVWEKYHINYTAMFDIDSRQLHKTQVFIRSATTLAISWGVGVVLYMLSSYNQIHILGASLDSFPLILSLVFWALVFCPFDLFHKSARGWLFRHLGNFFFGPFVRVDFPSFFLADQLCSMGIMLIDIEYAFCYYSNYFSSTHDILGVQCSSLNRYIQPLLIASPYLWRFFQCLRQYYDSTPIPISPSTLLPLNHSHHIHNQKSHITTHKPITPLLNAGKYATSLCVISLSALDSLYKVNPTDWTIYKSWWVFAMICSTLYSYSWDIKMDWGLLKPDAKNPLLRTTLIFENKYIYYFAMIANLIMRVTWVITLSPAFFGVTLSRDILISIMSSVEVTRRIMWNFFRLENEQENNPKKYKLVASKGTKN